MGCANTAERPVSFGRRSVTLPESKRRYRVLMRAKGWVLVTDSTFGQAPAPLAAVRALAAAGYRPAVAVSNLRSLAAASRHCARRIPVPAVDDPAYRAAIQDLMARGGYLTVLPSSDAAIVALGAPGGDLIDKARLATLAAEAGVPTPPGEVVSAPADVSRAAARLSFPIVVKPSLKADRASVPAFRADAPADLDGELPLPAVLQTYVREPMRAVGGVMWKGRIVAAVHQRYVRIWPADCGIASAAVSVEPDLEVEAGLERLLGGFEGIFQAQFAGPHLLDLNPRVYGSLPLAVASGANLPAIWCGLLAGGTPEPVRGRPGARYRWLEGDVRNRLRAWRSGEIGVLTMIRDLLPRPGTAASTESWRDPGPAVARLRHAVRTRRERA